MVTVTVTGFLVVVVAAVAAVAVQARGIYHLGEVAGWAAG